MNDFYQAAYVIALYFILYRTLRVPPSLACVRAQYLS